MCGNGIAISGRPMICPFWKFVPAYMLSFVNSFVYPFGGPSVDVGAMYSVHEDEEGGALLLSLLCAASVRRVVSRVDIITSRSSASEVILAASTCAAGVLQGYLLFMVGK